MLWMHLSLGHMETMGPRPTTRPRRDTGTDCRAAGYWEQSAPGTHTATIMFVGWSVQPAQVCGV